MKTITLKVVGDVNYKQVLLALAAAPGGMDTSMGIDEIRRGVRVLDALEAAADPSPDAPANFDLEDADYNFLRQRVVDARFVRVDRGLVQFVDDITGS